ncbi:hypothetical protein JCM17961_14240 [Endothiovibrio diazotrophicus]
MSERAERAKEIINNHSMWGASMGLIPFPMVDMAAITAVQVKMIHNLSHLYEVEFRKDLAKSLIGALLGGGVPYFLTTRGLGSLAKSIPFVGQFMGIAVMPALAGACSLALGRVFAQHYEAGGTLLDFDAEKMREHFKKEFEAAKSETEEAQATGKSAPASA